MFTRPDGLLGEPVVYKGPSAALVEKRRRTKAAADLRQRQLAVPRHRSPLMALSHESRRRVLLFPAGGLLGMDEPRARERLDERARLSASERRKPPREDEAAALSLLMQDEGTLITEQGSLETPGAASGLRSASRPAQGSLLRALRRYENVDRAADPSRAALRRDAQVAWMAADARAAEAACADARVVNEARRKRLAWEKWERERPKLVCEPLPLGLRLRGAYEEAGDAADTAPAPAPVAEAAGAPPSALAARGLQLRERGGDGRPVPGVVGPAGPRELRQHRVRVGGQRRAEALVDHRDRERDALEVGPVVVGAAPRRDLEGDDGEGVDVGGAAVGLGLEDLRRHPLGRAAARGHRRRRRRRGASVPREADVAELDAVADVAEHVRRLDVAVEHGRPVRVEVRQTPRDAERDDAPPRRGPRRVRAERVPEAARGDVLRHDGVVRRAGLEGRAHEEAHVRVPEPRLGGKRARNSQRLLFPPLVSADFGTSGHPPERARSLDAFSRTRARGTLTLKRR